MPCRTRTPAITRPGTDHPQDHPGAALPHLRPRRVAERSASSASSTALLSPRSPAAMQQRTSASARTPSPTPLPARSQAPLAAGATRLLLQRNGPRGDGFQQLLARQGSHSGVWHGHNGSPALSAHGASNSSHSQLKCALFRLGVAV